MPKNKDWKRVVRERMAKTGESYTAARAMLVARNPARSYAAPAKEWPKLAGIADAVVQEKTGRSWRQWVTLLEQAGARELSHRDIARHLRTLGVSSWWAQSVTVGFERITGLRGVGQRRDGAYDANKTRTLDAPVAKVFGMLSNATQRKRWMGDGFVRTRSSVANKSLRADWSDGTQVNFFLVAKAPTKTSLAVQHTKLPSSADVTRAKREWGERFDALARLLPAPNASRRPAR
ncbi:MAG: hypothetical protein R3B13_05390 [Polyangiaceae bacterium]